MMKRVLGGIAIATLVFGAQAQAQNPRRAFGARAQAPPVPQELWERGARRIRAIQTEPNLFGHAAAKAFAASKQRFAGHSLPMEVNVFENASLPVTWTEVEAQTNARSFVWTGRVTGFPDSQAVMIAGEDGSLTGNISRGDGTMFQIRTTEDGVAWAREIDQSQFPDELPPVEQQTLPFEPEDTGLMDKAATTGTAPVVDVMVLYTPRARQAAGGTQAMVRLVQLGVAETNQGYRNSGVRHSIRLVYVGEVAYSESGDFQTDLNRLSNARDGYIDNIHTLRNTYGADLVSLWIEDAQVCGVGNLLSNLRVVDPSRGFSVVSRSCATGYYSFGHELGHNLGAMHAREDGTGPGAYTDSYAFISPRIFRTVMAYNGACSCPRVNVWSNPAVRVNNYAAGTATTQNAATLNATAAMVASYRAATVRDEPRQDALPESNHPYADNLDQIWTYAIPGAAGLSITFDAKTSVERGYDFIAITDEAGRPVSGSPFTGTALAGRTVQVAGPTVRIRLIADESLSDYGFRVTQVETR